MEWLSFTPRQIYHSCYVVLSALFSISTTPYADEPISPSASAIAFSLGAFVRSALSWLFLVYSELYRCLGIPLLTGSLLLASLVFQWESELSKGFTSSVDASVIAAIVAAVASLASMIGTYLFTRRQSSATVNKIEAESKNIESATRVEEFNALTDRLYKLLDAKDGDVKKLQEQFSAQENIISSLKITAEKNRVESESTRITLNRTRDALAYLREQVFNDYPQAVSISYDIESGKRQRPFNGSANHDSDITETH